jgi:hypothetical protein
MIYIIFFTGKKKNRSLHRDNFENQKSGVTSLFILFYIYIHTIYCSINHTGEDKMDVPTIKVHVYYGGRLSKQHDNFSAIKKRLGIRWKGKFRFGFEEKNVDEIKHWTPAALVAWLLNCDIHLVICHPHQGMKQTLSTTALYAEMSKLYHHIGFPSGEFLRCPIWSQNKIEYLHAVPAITNPTLRIWLDQNCLKSQEIFIHRYAHLRFTLST